MTEETLGERMTEKRVVKGLNILTCIMIFLAIFPLFSGWFLPVTFQTKNVNVKIPDYIWLSSAAFHVIITTIWTSITIAAFRDKDSTKESKTAAFVGLLFVGLCLTSSVFLFIWFCRDR